MWASGTSAADKPVYAPPEAWVRPAVISDMPKPADGSPLQILLLDSQTRFAPEADEFYVESAIRILTPQGLSSFATIPLAWSPDTETLVIHRISLIRNGKTIDLLQGGKNISIIRRETNLERAMLDGRLTATLQPEGLQVGDTLDLAITVERRDPVFQGRSQALSFLRNVGVAGRVRFRFSWPDVKPITWRATPGFPQPTLTHEGGASELLVDEKNVTSPNPPKDAPERFSEVGFLELSQFRSWADVSALMAPLYDKASTLKAGSSLEAEIAKIRASSTDLKVRAQAALRLVQDHVHYVLLGMDLGGYVPADADTTWTRRFGDCKGKTALLLALLHGLDIDAQPALVNTVQGDGLAQRLPMLSFDHVFVRAVINGKVYWLDGTRPADRDLDEIPVPDVGWVLPVQAQGAELVLVRPRPLDAPAFESVKELDASAGYGVPAKAHVEHIFRGDDATIWNFALSALGHDDAERKEKEYWRENLPWVEPKMVGFTYDDAHHVLRMTLDGQGKMDWSKTGEVWDYDIGDSNLGFDTSFKREPGPNADAPIAVPYPIFKRWTVRIVLPGRGGGFHVLYGQDLDKAIAARRFHRRTALKDGVVTMVAEEQSLAQEFPMDEASSAEAQLRAMSEHDVFVRNADGPATEPSAIGEQATASTPVTAAEFSSRGATEMGRREFDKAIADFTAAARLEPTNAKHLYNLGVARAGKGDRELALADFDQAIRLNPNDALAYMGRAELRLAMHREDAAWSDYDQAVKLAPKDLRPLRFRWQAYERAGRYGDALHDLDTLLARSPASSRATLLNSRCWLRMEWDRELTTALADCDEALTANPNAAEYLDSRGFVELRMGQYDKAIQDFDRALALYSQLASSLFGRGVARLEKNDPQGKADLAAAAKADPDVGNRFARLGLKPPPK